MAKAAIAKTQSALGRYERLKRETEAEAASMTPKRKKTTGEKVAGALIQGKKNIKNAARATYDVARSKLRGRQMRKDLAEKKRQRRSLGTALGERAKFIQRMNQLGKGGKTITLEDYGKALHPNIKQKKQGVTRSRSTRIEAR